MVSLAEVPPSIPVRPAGRFWRKLLAFSGPGFLVAVGYMELGNWETDLAGRAKFGYTLLSVKRVLQLHEAQSVLESLFLWLEVPASSAAQDAAGLKHCVSMATVRAIARLRTTLVWQQWSIIT